MSVRRFTIALYPFSANWRNPAFEGWAPVPTRGVSSKYLGKSACAESAGPWAGVDVGVCAGACLAHTGNGAVTRTIAINAHQMVLIIPPLHSPLGDARRLCFQ